MHAEARRVLQKRLGTLTTNLPLGLLPRRVVVQVQAQLQQEIRRYVELKQRNSGSYGGSPPKFSYGTTPPRGGGSPYGSLNSSSGRVRQYASSPPRGGGYSSPSPRQSGEYEKENPAGIAIPGAT